MFCICFFFFFFFFNDTATTEIYTLSLHDALPIRPAPRSPQVPQPARACRRCAAPRGWGANSSDRRFPRTPTSAMPDAHDDDLIAFNRIENKVLPKASDGQHSYVRLIFHVALPGIWSDGQS